jgi:hypothetical protein
MYKYRKAIFCMLLFLPLISCTVTTAALKKNWGKIVPDDQARNSFETYQVSPDINYYISGSDVYPFAILGLNKEYILDSTLWKKVELTQAKLRELVTDMQSKAMGFRQSSFGFAVLNDRGGQIGVWYSILSASTSVQMKEDKKVMIYTPDPDTYNKYEEKSSKRMH